MKDRIRAEIQRFFAQSPDNWLAATQAPFYDEPLVGFADADDAIFGEYKTLLGPEHHTPAEAYEKTFGPGRYHGGTVISVAAPIHARIRQANAARRDHASREWALLRSYGDDLLLKAFCAHLERFLSGQGHPAVAPCMAPWHQIVRRPGGALANWSERHVAYAAGLGTFSLNDGFITEKGVAIRLVSFVTDLKVPADPRTAANHLANCLACSRGVCGACIKRCPVGAITSAGHDKLKCFQAAYGEASRQLAQSYGGNPAMGSGCGLCQTGVPCEFRNPAHRRA